MKKIMFLLFAATAVAAICTGCDKSVDVGIPPVTTPAEVTAFFEENLPANENGLTFPVGFDFGDADQNDTVCLVINSAEEFAAVAPPSVELPSIDFAKYTLVIGQHSMGDPGYRLESQSVDTEAEKTELYLVYKKLSGASAAIQTTFYHWGLYSKLPQKPINTNVRVI